MLKLVIRDTHHAAGLFLEQVDNVRQLIAELKALKRVPSASLYLEGLAERCLRRGWTVIPADPLIRGCTSRTHIVELHLDPNQPGAPFVGIYEPGEDGTPCRRLHDSLEGLASRLRLPPTNNTGTMPATVQQPSALAA
ncbi:hypothetical protein D3869_23565 (plasmid) [Azospirillum brasilense]|uniref:Uncharacterized protein n=1 Tax=Azospirillum brasilense TaxID=192 RepID=A0A4D8R5C1_AZOBR|nr:hypothetical protein [Azospirillum brasilense]QCO18248.1 hypothetical protein D3869_23565 [Azospirillum brasilense]